MRTLILSIEAEFRRHQTIAERALAQVAEEQLTAPGPGDGSSLATIVWHIAGNLRSRFTDFLTTDGEKPWRHREEEFERRVVTREDLEKRWADGWKILLDTLASLTDADLARTVTIRRQELAVHQALHRSLAHISYHVGQIVYIAKAWCGSDWAYLSIPPGQSEAYNRHPTLEKPSATHQ